MDEAVKDKNRVDTTVVQAKKTIKPFFNQKVTGVKNSQHERQLKKHNKLIDRQKNRKMRLISDDTNNLRHEFKLIQLSKQKNDLEIRKRDNPVEDYSLHEAGIATSERFLRNSVQSYYLDKTNSFRRRSIPDPEHVTPLIARARESLRNKERILRKNDRDILTAEEERMRSNSRRSRRSQSLVESLGEYLHESTSTSSYDSPCGPELGQIFTRNYTEGNILSTDIYELNDPQLNINKSHSNPNLLSNELYGHERKCVTFNLQDRNECVKPKTAFNRTKQQISPTLRIASGQRFLKPSNTDDLVDPGLLNKSGGYSRRKSVESSISSSNTMTKEQFASEQDSLKLRIDRFLSGLNEKSSDENMDEKQAANVTGNKDMNGTPKYQSYYSQSNEQVKGDEIPYTTTEATIQAIKARQASLEVSKPISTGIGGNNSAFGQTNSPPEQKVSRWRTLAEKVTDNNDDTLSNFPPKNQNAMNSRENEAPQRRRSSVTGIPQHSMNRARRHTASSKLRKIVDDLMKRKTRYELNELEEVRQRMKEEEEQKSLTAEPAERYEVEEEYSS
ncbi:uncharacterized protein LOC141901055 [Tubulanus polymorphus]|uniref:uncharacterized protein LOC141901055 n=1 Tax=Tubulanus polymorphus TaxID=672921 RepID=UPI003DA2519B